MKIDELIKLLNNCEYDVRFTITKSRGCTLMKIVNLDNAHNFIETKLVNPDPMALSKSIHEDLERIK